MAEGAVRPVIVVMVLVLVQDGHGVLLVDDQDAVEEFATHAADEALSDRVGPRCAHRRPDDADIDRGEDGVEPGGELGIAIPEEEPKATTGVAKVHEQVARLLVTQAPVG